MGKKKRCRKIRMKNRQWKRLLERMVRNSRISRQQLALICFLEGHNYRDLPDIGEICIRCGEEFQKRGSAFETGEALRRVINNYENE